MRSSVHGSTDRDRSIDQLLRQAGQSAAAGPATDQCVDGERLAAWADGSLPGPDASRVERHVADCPRCQSLAAAFVRTEPPATALAAAPRSVFTWHLRWLVPVATAATVAGIWVALPPDRRDAAAPSTDARVVGRAESDARAVTPLPAPPAAPAERAGAQAEAPQAKAPPSNEPAAGFRGARPDAPAPVPRKSTAGQPGTSELRAPALKEAAGRTAPNLARERLEEEPAGRKEKAADRLADADRQARAAKTSARAVADERKAPPPPPAAAPAPQTRDRVITRDQVIAVGAAASAIDIASPDPSNRWRVTGGTQVYRSTDAGATWSRADISPPHPILAAHAPAPAIAWFVGERGLVFVTRDAATFERVPFVEETRLIGVQAVDHRQATVTTADGRTFRTTDGGRTWSR